MTSNLGAPASHTARKTAPNLTRAGIVIAAVLALVDIVGGVAQLAPGSLLPPEVAVVAIVLGVGTAVLVPIAWRGSRWSIWLMAALRALSALTAVPAFFVPDVPTAAVLAAAVTVVVTVVAIVLLLLKGQRS
ncbi:hypothetical protein [Microbacterium lushaniae]|uniref:Uncharacterized protein n=1 Tax=Microbacterium lushaniae TaxID=2614639 RepID=A0A5J6L4U0_9MICO|nr:hypothetical protein [Microbacterium lushaniae]QEW03487.1 hypothetical protein F6J85_10490 [Microbacterium lushaniae]